MKNSLSKRFTIAMVSLAVGGILFSAILIQLALGWNFERYLGNVQEEQNRLIMDTLVELYSESTSWQAVRLSTMHVGSTTGAQIRVFDTSGRLVADSLSGMMQGMQGRRWERVQEARSQTYTYALTVTGIKVGTVEITYLGQQGLWTAEALVFRRTVQQSAFITGLIAIVVAILVASMLARRLTGRLHILTAAAEKWGRGTFAARANVDGNDELAVLGETMNRMALSLAEQSDLRRKLTGDISHELRTPLTTIQSYLEAFQDGVLPANTDNVHSVLEESHRLGQLVNDLQELTNAEFHGRNVSLQPLDLANFITAEVERTRPLLQQKGIALQLELPPTGIYGLADKALLARVVSNLLMNAYKYTSQGGIITVRMFTRGEEVGVCVADTGIGIATEHLPYLFERFYRVDPSRTRATGGSGIGLAIVKELMETMGGRVEVASEPGQGSRFCFYLALTESK